MSRTAFGQTFGDALASVTSGENFEQDMEGFAGRRIARPGSAPILCNPRLPKVCLPFEVFFRR